MEISTQNPGKEAGREVSVVVPSYNHALFVEKCLRSIFRQTLRPHELYVIDDGSRDDSASVIDRVLKECPFPCEFTTREHRGLSATLNEAFARTSGRYFAYLGSDDLWLPDFLSARISQLEASPGAVLAYGNAYSINAEDQIIDCSTDWACYVAGDARHMLLTTLAPLSPTVVYRREALASHRWNEQARLEDYELYLSLSVDGDFAFDRRVLSAWRVHKYNTSSNIALMLEERLAAQRVAAPRLGLSGRELHDYEALARFRGAQELMRQGRKLASAKLLLSSPGGVPSAAEGARLIAGLVTPRALLRRRQEHRRQNANDRYGSVQL